MSTAAQYHEEEVLGKAYDARLMKRLLRYVRPYRWIAALAVVVLLIVAVLQTGLAFVAKWAIDDYIKPGTADGFENMAFAYLAISFAVFIFTFAQIWITMLLGQRVQHDIRLQVFDHVQRLHLGYFDRNPVGRLVTRVTNDVNTLNELFSSGVVNIIGDLLMIVFYVAALFYVSWKLALVVFISVPLLLIVSFVFRAKARDAYRVVRLKLARLNAFVQEHVTGMGLVQLFNRENTTYNRFDDINADLRQAHLRNVLYYAVFYPVVEVIGALALSLLFYYGASLMNAGTLSFGDLFLFIYLLERFFHPIRDLSEKYNVLQASMASSERIFGLLDTKPAIVDREKTIQPKEFTGRIDVENLWFAYKDEEWVLKDVSFNVEPGEKVAIVGATGAGKTSLISLLFRFYDYQKGAIKLDGVDLKDWPRNELRRHLALVLQDVFLFSGDFAGNVRLRDESISDDEVERAMERVGFDRFLGVFPDGLNTEVKERGVTLSTGQKQLLSFARALAFDPDILILDEATSSVDSETERLIQEALDELLKGRTSIVIAHRLSTVEKADKIIVLHHGEIREVGSHDELLQQKGIYHKLYQIQYKHQAPDARTSTGAKVG